MKKQILVISLIMILFLLGCASPITTGEVNVVSPEEMQTLLEAEDVQLVDVRTVAEFNEAHIVNAQNIDFTSDTFDDDIKGLDKEKPVLLYCQRGGRSAKCAEKMIEAGFKKIYDLKGGLSKWKHEGLKLQAKS